MNKVHIHIQSIHEMQDERGIDYQRQDQVIKKEENKQRICLSRDVETGKKEQKRREL